MRRRIDRILWPAVSSLFGYIALLALTPLVSIGAGSLATSIHNGVVQTVVLVIMLVGAVVWALAVTASHARFHEWKVQVQSQSDPDIIPIKRSRGRK